MKIKIEDIKVLLINILICGLILLVGYLIQGPRLAHYLGLD